jgi:hypothetical protein
VDTGEALTRWTVRLALALAVAAVLVRCTRITPRDSPMRARWLWTLGCPAFLAHVVCAFHFYHHWSHAAAYEETARRTAEVAGLEWGGGLYFNYAFAAVWAADVAWWWVAPRGYARRPRWVDGAVYGFFAFLAFNATVVFGSGPIRWAGVAVSLGLVALAVIRSATPRRRLQDATPRNASAKRR